MCPGFAICDLQMKDNVMSKANKIGIQGKVCKIILSNIFGEDFGTTRVPGFIDWDSQTDSYKNLDDYQPSGICYTH